MSDVAIDPRPLALGVIVARAVKSSDGAALSRVHSANEVISGRRSAGFLPPYGHARGKISENYNWPTSSSTSISVGDGYALSRACGER